MKRTIPTSTLLLAIIFQLISITTQSYLSDFECSLCHLSINEIEGLLNENQTTEYIEHYFRDQVCDKFGLDFFFLLILWGKLEYVCDVVVGVLPEIIEMISKEETATKLCRDVGVCTRSEGLGFLFLLIGIRAFSW